MKKLFCILVFISACEWDISKDMITESLSKCEKNEGLQFFRVEKDNSGVAVCTNGARFRINK